MTMTGRTFISDYWAALRLEEIGKADLRSGTLVGRDCCISGYGDGDTVKVGAGLSMSCTEPDGQLLK